VDIVQRQVSPDVADIAKVAEELADDRLRLTAVGAFEIAVLDNRDRRVDRSTNVVALGVDVDVEVDERLGGSE
jgi:ssRNA-specific RNase YbeY (16S rRNA maturation enzyme)